MAVITITNVTEWPVLVAPGEKALVELSVKNNTSNVISYIRIRFMAELENIDNSGSTGRVYCGYFPNEDGEKQRVDLAAGNTIKLTGYINVPAGLSDRFAAGVRVASVPIMYDIYYKGGGADTGNFSYAMNNMYVLNRRHNPQILKFELKRAESGIPNDEGEDVLTTLKLGLEDPTKTDFMGLTLYYAENEQVTTNSASIDLTAKIPQLLTGVVDDPSTIFNSFSNGSNWSFLLVFGDEYESTGLMMDIARAFANVHLSGKPEGGVCFGGFCANDTDATGKVIPKFECYYPAYFYGGIALGGAGDYSLEEQDTSSKWIDGKPIYRKVFIGTVKASTTTDLATNIGFETVIRCDGILSYVNSSGMTVRRSLNFFSSTSLHSRVYTGTSDGGKIQINSTQAGDVFVVLEYTKSTDAATTEVT